MNGKIGYIREDIPSFDIPPYEGDRYEAWVPDTLDLAERAALAINGLTGSTDPAADYEAYWQVNFFREPPIMWHDVDDIQPKFMEALPLLRTATGNDLNDHVDPVWMRVLLRCIGPDGLVYMPLKGRPWVKMYDSPDGYPNPVWRENGETTTIDDESVTQVSMNWIAVARVMSTMMLYYLRDGNPIWRELVERMTDRVAELAIDKGTYCYFPCGSFEPNAKLREDVEMPRGHGVGEGAARLIRGLAHVYRATGYQPAAVLAGKIAVYIREHAGFFDQDGGFIDASETYVHFHSHAMNLLGLLDYAVAVDDADLIQFVRKGYEYARANGSPTVGFFPELIENLPTAYPYPKEQRGRLVSETCEVADMIALAIKLTEAGAGDYWDDADRYLRNQFVENQLTTIDWVERIPNPTKATPVAFHETADRVAERNLGAFAGWPSANDWTIYVGIQHCCTANGALVLYYAWESILQFNDGVLRVNLLLNRASPWADVNSHIPYEGRVDLKIKEKCEKVSIRVPEWIESGSRLVSCEANDEERELRWEGRYVTAGSAAPGDTMTLTFPISERTVTEMLGCVLYTLVIKGNDVVFIDPPGRNCPLYQRTHYRRNETRWRNMGRFVPQECMKW